MAMMLFIKLVFVFMLWGVHGNFGCLDGLNDDEDMTDAWPIYSGDQVDRPCVPACNETHYGENCTRECSARHCSGISGCNSTTGRCEGGCQEGWRGTDCSTCDETHYGENCTRECSARHCSGISSCESTRGRCDDGCQEGWRGTDCTELGALFPVALAYCLTVFLVIVVTVVTLCWRKRRPSKSDPYEKTTKKNDVYSERDADNDENLYDDIN